MAKVIGINAVMFYSNDPGALSRWYDAHLGIQTQLNPEDGCYYGDVVDPKTNAVTHVGFYPARTALGAGGRTVMVNYRVDRLEEFVSHLKSKGVFVEKREEFDFGSFAYVRDPDGNPVEIWCEKAGSACGMAS